jgi:hypothetical protein
LLSATDFKALYLNQVTSYSTLVAKMPIALENDRVRRARDKEKKSKAKRKKGGKRASACGTEEAAAATQPAQSQQVAVEAGAAAVDLPRTKTKQSVNESPCLRHCVHGASIPGGSGGGGTTAGGGGRWVHVTDT